MASAEGGDKYRSFLHGEGEKNTVWRHGAPPNYDLVNKLFEDERTKEWAEGSVEERVQRLLKTWEMELVHKEVRGMGGYNAFLATTLPPEHRIYDPDAETVESATATFLTAFPRGFAIEVLDVYSGPPNPRIAFKFRHWGHMEGPFKGHPPHGRRVEFFGVCVFHVDEDTKVEKAEFFYERGNFLASFLSAPPAAAASASGCPVMRGD
ncbi:hypothetical protein TRIUR3_07764 [Triticum urartu]|uniref:Pathogen-related protein n=1 Tax=Triticum urartu TaxID=4572 RepID=M7ZN72_TRIUA|nr:hypothetical protein TRIUR3_07764 [Triticum urartu]